MDNSLGITVCLVSKKMIKSLKKVRLKKKSLDGENESLHAKFMLNNTVVK